MPRRQTSTGRFIDSDSACVESSSPVVDSHPSRAFRTRSLLAAALAVAGGALGCNQGYAVVTVNEPADAGRSLPQVYQIRSTAYDGNGTDSKLGPFQNDPIAFPKTYVIKLPPAATSLQVLVEGLDVNGNTLLRGLSPNTTFAAGASDVAVAVMLSKPCTSAYDCGSGNLCAGTVTCGVASFVPDAGACVGVSPPAPPGFGTSCNADGGRCDAHLSCVTPWGSCGDGVIGNDPLPDGGLLQEQCDWGEASNSSGCNGPGGDCNADTANHCRTNCSLPRCGDAILDTGEVCDLGDGVNGIIWNGTLPSPRCNATCTLKGIATPIAGNGDFYPDGGPCTVGCIADGPGATAQFNGPAGLAIIGRTLYVADYFDMAIRAIDLTSPEYTVSTVAGNPALALNQEGPGLIDGGFLLPLGLLDLNGLLLVGTFANIESVSLPDDYVHVFAGRATDSPGSSDGPFATAGFDDVSGLAWDGRNTVYSIDETGHAVRSLDVDAGIASTLVKNNGSNIYFEDPYGIAFLDAGLFVTDFNAGYLKRVDTATAAVRNVAGNGGTGYVDCDAGCLASGGSSSFAYPYGLCTDGRSIYVMDGHNGAVRQLDPVSDAVTTVVNGLDDPTDCVWDFDAGVLYVSDQSPLATPDGKGNRIYMIQ